MGLLCIGRKYINNEVILDFKYEDIYLFEDDVLRAIDKEGNIYYFNLKGEQVDDY